MTARHLYLARHGAADVFGELTDIGRRQMSRLGERLSAMPVSAVWHSPLPRAAASAREVARHLPNATVAEAAELIDHVPHVPGAAEMPSSWTGFFDGYDQTEAAEGRRTADALATRFASTGSGSREADVHEVLITHDYPIAWLVRHTLDAPPARWLGLNSANGALTVIEYRASLPPTLVMFNDMTHLAPDLRWTGFPDTDRP